MDVVFWIIGIAALLAMMAYGAIGVCLLAAKYRMSHVASRRGRVGAVAATSIADWRYRAP